MQQYDSNQYVDIFYRLPAEIKDMVAATSTTEHLWKIGQKHDLHIDRIGIMTDIAFDVMMGIIASKNFVKELQDSLQISALDAAVLARDIDENVFKPIKEIMVRTYGETAPNKPSSSLVTITEDEEDHMNLDKDALLREIESPSEAVVKREEASELVSLSASEAIKKESEDLTNLPAHQLTSLSLDSQTVLSASQAQESEKLTSSLANKLISSPSSFDKIADMKLSQTTVMPKEAGKLVSLRASEENTEAAKLPETNKPTSLPANKLSEAPQPSRPVDPYREAIN